MLLSTKNQLHLFGLMSQGTLGFFTFCSLKKAINFKTILYVFLGFILVHCYQLNKGPSPFINHQMSANSILWAWLEWDKQLKCLFSTACILCHSAKFPQGAELSTFPSSSYTGRLAECYWSILTHPPSHLPRSCWGSFLLIYLSSWNEQALSRTICQEC